MEKFSAYNDPLSGINPFVNPKRRPYSVLGCLRALALIPLALVMLWTNVNVVQLLVGIRSPKPPKARVLAANASSFLDVFVLKYLTGIRNFYYVTDSGFVDVHTGQFHQRVAEPCVLFPEGCRTNNRAILQFTRDVRVDHVCCLGYSGECINMYGGLLGFVPRFLASRCSVDVRFRKSTDPHDICELGGLPQVRWTSKDRDRFMEEFAKDSRINGK